MINRAPELDKIADYFVYDGAAAKKKFVDGITENTGLHLVSKFPKNANMRYLYTGPRMPDRGDRGNMTEKSDGKNSRRTVSTPVMKMMKSLYILLSSIACC
nr:hypothetical protein [Candidatus Electrothrix aestuarii]